MLTKKIDDLEAVVIDPRLFAKCVMSAGNRDAAVRNFITAKGRERVA